MRILLIDISNGGYTLQLMRNIKKYYPEVNIHILTSISQKEIYQNGGEEFLKNVIFYSNKRFIKTLSLIGKVFLLEKYDVIHSLWIEKQWGISSNILSKKTKVWLSSVGGSDLYRHSAIKDIRKWQDKVLKHATGFSCENTSTREYFYKVYGEWLRRKRLNINRYGVDIIDEINLLSDIKTEDIKNKWNIPSDKIVVMLGHNASEAHQHRDMIKAIECMDSGILEKYYFVIPMTYPSSAVAYIKEIDELMCNVSPQYQILTKYMNVKEMAEITRCCDVMIHVQTTDQLSSTMMAHMYDENIVIAGSWLPYSDIRDAGIEFYDVDNISDITALLTDIVENFDTYKEKMKNNRENVYRFSSWEYAAKAWYNTYIELLEESKK